MTTPASSVMGSLNHKSRRSGGCPCTPPRGAVPLSVHANTRLLCHVTHHNASPRGDSSSPSTLTGAQICSGNGNSGGSAASLGGGVSSGSSTMFVQLVDSGSSMAGIPASTYSEHCVLAASKVLCRGDNKKVRKISSLSIVRWLTPLPCRSMQGSASSSTVALTAVFSPSTFNKQSSSLLVCKSFGSMLARCIQASFFRSLGRPSSKSGSMLTSYA